MCGLAGIWTKKTCHAEELRDIVKPMSESLIHRGPDSSGEWVDPENGVALGHRRLSILDLSPAGHQPMYSSSKRYVIAYNGEVYNFIELRSELEKGELALDLRGHSDTELILAVIEAWGLDKAISYFIGMFSFALWDLQEKIC